MTARRTIRRLARLLAGALAAAAPAGAQTRSRVSALPTREVTFTVTETGLQGPDTAVAELVNVRLVNRGREIHQFQMLAVAPNHTAQETISLLLASGRLPPWLALATGVGPIPAGQTATVIQRLQPGEYIVFDNLPGPDRVSYAQRGVIRRLVVRGTVTLNQAVLPADAGMIIGDISFRFGKMLKQGDDYVLVEGRDRMVTLRAGENVIQLENAGSGHAIVLLKAESPSAMHRYARWLDGAASDPGGIVSGGLPSVQNGSRTFLRVRLEHGTYFFFCPVTHRRTGLRGFQTGEFAQLVVR